jgi:hypothetical protein
MTVDRGFEVFREVLEAMLCENANITATAAAHHPSSPYKHASDITRNPGRAALLKEYVERQDELRRLLERSNKQSKTNLTNKVADLEYKNAQLQAQRDLLIASHRSMILAVGEMGGMAAWRRFFEPWQEAMNSLKAMGAMPNADVLPLVPNHRARNAKTNG